MKLSENCREQKKRNSYSLNVLKKISLLTVFTFLLINGFAQNMGDVSDLKGPYLGQPPPGLVPEFFADGFLANNYPSFHSNVMFTPDGKECYWQANLSNGQRAIVYSKIKNGGWSFPEIAQFSKTEFRDDCPFISPDGMRFYFISRRPMNQDEKEGKENIWVMNRTDKGWSDPQAMPPLINSLQGIHWQISVDSDYNLYFGICLDIYSANRMGDIYFSRYMKGEYQKPEKLGDHINSMAYNSSPYISPNGSYLIFSRENPKTHKIRIYISYRKNDHQWTEAKEFSEVIGDKAQTCPMVTADGKYLFFLRYVNSFCQPFWVDAKVIETFKKISIR